MNGALLSLIVYSTYSFSGSFINTHFYSGNSSSMDKCILSDMSDNLESQKGRAEFSVKIASDQW